MPHLQASRPQQIPEVSKSGLSQSQHNFNLVQTQLQNTNIAKLTFKRPIKQRLKSKEISHFIWQIWIDLHNDFASQSGKLEMAGHTKPVTYVPLYNRMPPFEPQVNSNNFFFSGLKEKLYLAEMTTLWWLVKLIQIERSYM